MARKMQKVKFNQNLILEVMGASLLVQKVPGLLNRLLFTNNPLTGMTATLAGVGATWLAGSFFNKPNMANAGIALAGVELISPFIDQITDAGKPIQQLPAIPAPPVKPAKTNLPDYQPEMPVSMEDYISLNDYIPYPNQYSYIDYRDSY